MHKNDNTEKKIHELTKQKTIISRKTNAKKNLNEKPHGTLIFRINDIGRQLTLSTCDAEMGNREAVGVCGVPGVLGRDATQTRGKQSHGGGGGEAGRYCRFTTRDAPTDTRGGSVHTRHSSVDSETHFLPSIPSLPRRPCFSTP